MGVSSDPRINLNAMCEKEVGVTPKTSEMGLGRSSTGDGVELRWTACFGSKWAAFQVGSKGSWK